MEKSCAWIKLETKGAVKPGPLAHHTSVVYNDKMYLYGGNKEGEENQKFFSLDLKTLTWQLIQPVSNHILIYI